MNIGKILFYKDENNDIDINDLKMKLWCNEITQVQWIKKYLYQCCISIESMCDFYDYKVFKVDDSATSQLLSNENYFVRALHFDESSLKGLMLCNSIYCCAIIFTNLFDQYVDDNETSSDEEIDKINELIMDFDDDMNRETMKKLHGYIVNTW